MHTIEKYEYDISHKLDNFEKFVPRQAMSRFMTRYELFKLISNSKGSIVECGVHYGGGLLAWAKLSSIIEPYAVGRKIIGFDTFEGFPHLTNEDLESKKHEELKIGEYNPHRNILAEIEDCITDYDNDRPLGHSPKIEIIKGDANETIPKYIEENRHLIISLLFLDFDLYQPTKTALNYFVERMPKGSVIAFDEINCSSWKGETIATLEYFKSMNNLELKSFNFDPRVGYAIIK